MANKPKSTSTKSTATSTKAPANDGNRSLISIITDGITLTPSQMETITGAVEQLSAAGTVTPGDIRTLREMASIMQRASETEAMMKTVTEEPRVWLALVRQRDLQAVSIRGFLRELRLTRIGETSASVASTKAKSKSGGGWEGIL